MVSWSGWTCDVLPHSLNFAGIIAGLVRGSHQSSTNPEVRQRQHQQHLVRRRRLGALRALQYNRSTVDLTLSFYRLCLVLPTFFAELWPSKRRVRWGRHENIKLANGSLERFS